MVTKDLHLLPILTLPLILTCIQYARKIFHLTVGTLLSPARSLLTCQSVVDTFIDSFVQRSLLIVDYSIFTVKEASLLRIRTATHRESI